jgi:striatin 1/3/4
MYLKGMVDTELIQNPLANFTIRKSMNGNILVNFLIIGLSIPTSVDWITQFEKIVCGYNDS